MTSVYYRTVSYTHLILQEDKDTVESILGTKSFEYPMFYKNETLRLLEDKVVPIIKKYEDIELLIGDVSSSLDTIDSVSYTHLDVYKRQDWRYSNSQNYQGKEKLWLRPSYGGAEAISVQS